MHLLECRHSRLCQMSAALAENAAKSEKAEQMAQDIQRAGKNRTLTFTSINNELFTNFFFFFR